MVEFLTTELRETRAAAKAAWEDRSWVAVNQLKKQGQEIYTKLQAAKEVQETRDPDEDLTEEQALHQVILPSIREMGRPMVEEIYRVCLELLGLHDDEQAEAPH